MNYDQGTKAATQRPALAEIYDSLQETGKRILEVRNRLSRAVNKFIPTPEAEGKDGSAPRGDGAIADLKEFSDDLKRLASLMESDMQKLEGII